MEELAVLARDMLIDIADIIGDISAIFRDLILLFFVKTIATIISKYN